MASLPPRSVLVFHPSVAPFVQQAARAFYEADLLARFSTSFRPDPESLTQRVAAGISRAAGVDLRRKLERRAITEVPAEFVESHSWREVLRLAVGAMDRSGRLTDLAWERAELGFGRRVAASLTPELSAVYGYEFGCRSVFARARELGIRTWYDLPAPEAHFVEELLRGEHEKFPELTTAYTRHTAAREARRTAHRRAEWDSADLAIVASEFTRKSYVADGRDGSKLRVVPYGAPPPAEANAAVKPRPSGPTRFVWAGTFSVRKGAHYLLEAWRAGGLGHSAVLDVYGTVALPDALVTSAPAGVTFHGPVSRPDLLAVFRESDALVFPTLCDGFGLVVTEAWSQGLPVVTTDRAGAADLLKPGENGFLVPPADPAALGAQLARIAASPESLQPLRERALATAAAWQWSDYRRALLKAVMPDSFAR